MKTLVIDLASHQGLLTCIDGAKVVSKKEVDHRISDAELMPIFEGVLEAAGWDKRVTLSPSAPLRTGSVEGSTRGGKRSRFDSAQRDMFAINRIACVIGPGGFTSLRVAVAFGNALSYTLDVPVTGIHLSDLYLAREIPSPKNQIPIVWVHSTKKKELFVREPGKEPEWLQLEEFLAKISEGVQWMGELIPEHEAEVSKRGGTRAELQTVESILPAFVDALTYEKKTLEPWYGRKW
ncbi:MAG: hypothetical protein WCS85_05460 [Candidatus Peribacteraceae bacterium]|jgi:tRNA A37 threonylcarbamoyladenosine modification protein TsaB